MEDWANLKRTEKLVGEDGEPMMKADGVTPFVEIVEDTPLLINIKVGGLTGAAGHGPGPGALGVEW